MLKYGAVVADERIGLRSRLNFYLNTARKPIYDTKWKYDSWQYNDILQVTDPMYDEWMMLRNRGGSKTRDGSLMAVFLGFQHNRLGELNRVLWYAAGDSQLEQATQYFGENRYVKEVTKHRVLLVNGNIIKLRIMSKRQAASPRADIIFFDEEQDMKEDIYGIALGTQIGGGSKKIHMGTTELDTIFHKNYLRLAPRQRVLEHHVDEMSWETVEEALAKYDGQPQFLIDSQLWCKWVRAGGRIFENVEVRYLTAEETASLSIEHYYGIDPNPKSGHAMVKVRYIGDWGIYIEEEFPAYRDPFAFSSFIQKRLTDYSEVEIEENAGEEFLKVFENVTRHNYLGKVSVMRWDETNKVNRIFSIRKFMVIINPSCTEVLKHVKSAVWNPKEPKAKLLKTPEQHYLDAFIHACQRENRNVLATAENAAKAYGY